MTMNSLFDFDEAFKDVVKPEYQNNGMSSRSLNIKTKIKFKNKLKINHIDKILEELPLVDESLHIVSNGTFDYFNLIPRTIELANQNVETFYFSTWTMSHQNVISILEMFDQGIFKNIHALTGEYFKSRETAVYYILEMGIKERNQKLFSNKNHTKVTLLEIGNDYYVIEGSANFTANPRIENFIITNSKELFYFHKEWMDTLIK